MRPDGGCTHVPHAAVRRLYLSRMERLRTLLTPEQAAEYLQVSRSTVYRCIRDGRLVAARVGRSYRIARLSLDQLLWQSRTRDDVQLRAYSDADIAGFLRDDVRTEEERAIVAGVTLHDQSA